MFRNMKLKTRLMLAFAAIAVLASIGGVFSGYITYTVNSEYSYAIKNYGFAQGDVGKVLACLGSVNVSVHDFVSYTDAEDARKAGETYEAQLAKMETYFDKVESTIQSPATIAIFKQVRDAWGQYLPLSQELMKQGDTEDEAVVKQVQKRMVAELQPLYDSIYDGLAAIMTEKVDTGNALEERLSISIRNSVFFIYGLLLVSLLISLVMGTKIAKGIANPVYACAKRLNALVEGDLTSPVYVYDGKNEIGTLTLSTEEIVSGLNEIIRDEKYLLEEMAAGNFDVYSTAADKYVGDFRTILEAIRTINYHLSDTLGQINESSEQVSSGSDQVSSAAQNLSQGASEQAASIQRLRGQH